jgi:ADP-heptose:LPS heptosyltransferase
VIDFGQLGDVVLSLPALAALRAAFPQTKITVMTGLAAGEVVRLSGVADDVVTVDRVELRDGPKMRSIRAILGLALDVRRRHFDLVIDVHSLSETNILAFLSGAKYRLLANRESRSLDRLSNFRPAPPEEDKTKQAYERYLDVLTPLGVEGEAQEFRFRSADGDRHFADTIGLFPGAGHPDRQWPLAKFAELSRRVIDSGRRCVVFLGPEEMAMLADVKASFPQDVSVVDDLSIAEFIEATAKLAAFVTNDTGAMHLAACAGAPIVLVLHELAPLTYLPLTKKLAVVRDGAVDELTVDAVFSAIQELTGAANDKPAVT